MAIETNSEEGNGKKSYSSLTTTVKVFKILNEIKSMYELFDMTLISSKKNCKFNFSDSR